MVVVVVDLIKKQFLRTNKKKKNANLCQIYVDFSVRF